MAQNYEQLVQDVLNAKKDFNQLRVKNAQLEGDLKLARDQINQQRNINDRVVREKQIAESRLKGLQMQLTRLRSSYEISIQNVKTDIDSRHTEIQSVRDQINPHLDFEMMRMKILRQLDEQYGQKLQQRENKLNHAINTASEVTRQKEILEEKLILKERQLANTINQMRQAHIDEIENLTKAVTKLKGGNTSDDILKDMNRKLRKDNDELRMRLVQQDQEVDQLREERGRLKDESSSFILANNKTMDKLRDQVRIHRQEVDRLHKQVTNSTSERDRLMVVQKQKEIRKLEVEIEQLNEQLRAKDNKINRLNETISQLQVEIVRVNGKQQLTEDRQNLEIVRNTLQHLQRDYRNLQQRFEDVRKVNEQFVEKQERFKREIKDLKETIISRQTITRDSRTFNRDNNTRDISNTRNTENYNTEIHTTKVKTITVDNQEAFAEITELLSKKIEQLKKQLDKNKKQMADLRRKYDGNKQKLKQANTKIMELLQQKIKTSNSPQHFRLPNLLSPAPTLKKVFNFISEETTGHGPSPTNMKYNFNYIDDQQHKQFMSPQITPTNMIRIDRIQNTSIGSAGRSSDEFYEKSKSFKASKGRLVCVNHDQVL